MKVVFLEDIDFDHSPMVRSSLRTDVVAEYAAQYEKDKKSMPPLELFTEDNKTYLIADGMHRFQAMLSLKFKACNANCRKGGYESALEAALKSNESHGLRRSQADKRRCVQEAIKQWPKKSNNQIAAECLVDNHTVKAVRDGLESTGEVKIEPVRQARDGREVSAEKPKAKAKPESKADGNSQPDKPVKMTDADPLGTVISAYAMQFWIRSGEVREVLGTLAALSKELRRVSKEEDLMYGEVNFTAALGDLDKLWTNLATALPYCVCTTCNGQPKTQSGGCRMCKGRGLISKHRWDTLVPAEIKKVKLAKVKK